MEKYCLFFMAFLYVNTGLLVKAAESGDIFSLVNKNEKSFYFVVGSSGYVVAGSNGIEVFAGSLSPGEMISLPVIPRLSMILCLWPGNIENRSKPEIIKSFKETMMDKFYEELLFAIKPSLIYKAPFGFDRTRHLKLTQKNKLEPQEKKDRYGFLLDNNINQSDIEEQVLVLSPEKDRWEKSNVMFFPPQYSRLRSKVTEPPRRVRRFTTVQKPGNQVKFIETDNILFKLKNEDNNAVFVVIVNEGKVVGAQELGSGQELIKDNEEFNTKKSTQLFIWSGEEEIVKLLTNNKEEIVKLLANNDVGRSIDDINFDCSFGLCPPNYFIWLYENENRLQFFQWKDGVLGLQEIEKGRGFLKRTKSIVGNITREYFEQNLFVRTEDAGWKNAKDFFLWQRVKQAGIGE